MNSDTNPLIDSSISSSLSSENGISIQKLVLAEVNALITALRTNSRFTSKQRFQYEIPRNSENVLLASLKTLRDKCNTQYGYQELTFSAILQPFFAIIQSEDTTGPITGVALQSIQKLLEHPCITSQTESGRSIMSDIVQSVKLCQFEVTDAVTDEAILIKILQVFATVVNSDAGILLDESAILEVMKSCFRIGRETRPTELLRRSAENVLLEIIETVFRRVRQKIWPEMTKVFLFICGLCDPEEEGKSASVRLLGLTLANTVLDILGLKIVHFKSLLSVAQDQFSRALLRNSVTNNIVLLSQTIRAMHTLIQCAAPYLHQQIESFLLLTHLRLASDTKSTSLDHQELAMESLVELCNDEHFPIYLFEHFDMNNFSADLFETICKFLAQKVKDSESINALHILATQGLLGIIRNIAQRCISGSLQKENEKTASQLEEWRSRKNFKIKMQTIAASFNKEPKHGIKVLKKSGVLNTDATPLECAKFFKNYGNWLDKNALGRCLMLPDTFNQQILDHYLNMLEFKDMTLDEALRYLSHNVVIKGEAQEIMRMLDAFGNVYYQHNLQTTALVNSDAAVTLTVALFMLHTDIHNHQISEKMTCKQFIANCKGADSLKSVPEEQLAKLYDAILTKPFPISNMQSNLEPYKSNPIWEEVLSKSNQYSNDHPHQYTANTLLCCDMFGKIWSDVVTVITVALENTKDEQVKLSCIKGFQDVAMIASEFQLAHVFDALVISLCRFTKILDPSLDNAVAQFGQNETAQLVAKTVFLLTRKYGDNLREGWKNILELILKLYELDLLSWNDLSLDNKEVTENSANASSVMASFVKPKKRKSNTNASATASALSFLGFFQTASDDSLETKVFIDRAEQCVKECQIGNLILDAKFLHETSLKYLMNALIVRCSTIITNLTVKEERELYGNLFCFDLLIDITIANRERLALIWNHVSDQIRLFITNIATQFDQQGQKLKKEQHMIWERVVIALFRLLFKFGTITITHNMKQPDENTKQQQLQQQQLLYPLFELMDSTVNNILLQYVLPQCCQGLALLLQSSFQSNQMTSKLWEIWFRILRQGLAHKDCNAKSVELVKWIVKEGDFVWPDNIPSLVQLLVIMHQLEVVESMCSLHHRMFSLFSQQQIQQQHQQSNWTKSWIAILEGLAKLGSSFDKEMRNAAMGALQRIVLDKQMLDLSPKLLEQVLTRPVFNLMDELISDQFQKSIQLMKRSDLIQVEESRLRATNLVAKCYLHFLPLICKLTNYKDVWLGVMVHLKKYVTQIQQNSENLREAVPELLKNMILVMNSQQLFATEQELWTMTVNCLQPVAPQLIQEFESKIVLSVPQQQQANTAQQ